MSRSQSPLVPLPTKPLDRLLAPVERFLHVEAAGGVVLLACTVAALAVANSPFGEAYHHLWQTTIAVEIGALRLSYPLEHWINDGLMALFFFVVGLEVKRERVLGELRDPRAAALPIAAALGGMVVPAGMYLLVLGHTPVARGWGIPMATDIAFVVGCMAVLGDRMPRGLRVMLLSLAIADDIGAVLVIAVGYTGTIAWVPLALGAAGIGLVVMLQRAGIRSLRIYTLVGIAIWMAFLKSGVHATVAGVILGLLTPAHPYLGRGTFEQLLDQIGARLSSTGWMPSAERAAEVRRLRRASREIVSPLEYLESALHPWVSFAIMPVFALANAGVLLHVSDLRNPLALTVGISLLLGKPVGIVLFSWLAVALGVARLPERVSWPRLAGGGVLCGIGFTMSLFIANLALTDAALAAAKVGILGGSAVAAVVGMALLALSPPLRAVSSQLSAVSGQPPRK